MRLVSLAARAHVQAEADGGVAVVLIEIDHPDLAAPVRLSTDNTERLSEDPLLYGTRSAWRGADPATEPFVFLPVSVLLPSDLEDAPASARLVLENLDSALVELLRSFLTPAEVCIAVAMADTPDEPEAEWLGLRIVQAEADTGTILLAVSREEVEAEHFPTARLTRDRFPGLHA